MLSQISWRHTFYNPNLLAQEIALRFGGGGAYFALTGLSFTREGGLSLQIGAGQVIADAVIEYLGEVKAVADNHSGPTDRAWIWLSSAGTVSFQYNTLQPPSGSQVLIGSCTTSGGTITAIDTSGVLYARGNRLVRLVADVTTPTDVPSSLVRYIARNPFTFQEWEWTGDRYVTIPSTVNPLLVAEGGSGSTTQVNLLKANNLSDLASAATARANLGVNSSSPFQVSVSSGAAAFSWPSPTPSRAIVYVDATGGNINAEIPNLPSVASWNAQILVVKIDSSANTVTLNRAGSDTILGATTYVLTTQWQSALLDNNGIHSWYLA